MVRMLFLLKIPVKSSENGSGKRFFMAHLRIRKRSANEKRNGATDEKDGGPIVKSTCWSGRRQTQLVCNTLVTLWAIPARQGFSAFTCNSRSTPMLQCLHPISCSTFNGDGVRVTIATQRKGWRREVESSWSKHRISINEWRTKLSQLWWPWR